MQRRDVEVVVMSDMHLGTYGCHATKIVNYLQSISPNVLILNGDIIDCWQFSKHYFPPAHMEVIKEILSLLTKGTRVIYITGNHDEVLRRYSDLNIGNFSLTNKMVIEINGKMTWIFHGDVFDASTKGSAKMLAKLGGKGYDLLILLNRFVNWILNVTGYEKMSFSKRIKNGVKQAVAWINNFEHLAAELAIEKKYDYVICGHIHKPQHRVIENKNGKVTYLNSGDWVENLTSLELKNNSWSVYHYNPQEFSSTLQTQQHHVSITPSVLADEINMFIDSLMASEITKEKLTDTE